MHGLSVLWPLPYCIQEHILLYALYALYAFYTDPLKRAHPSQMTLEQTSTSLRYNSKFVYFWKLIKLKFLSYLSDNFSVSQQIIKISAQFNYPIHLFRGEISLKMTSRGEIFLVDLMYLNQDHPVDINSRLCGSS